MRSSHSTSHSTAESGVVERLRAAGCVFAEEEALLLVTEAATPATLEAMVDRRTSGEPLEQVLGWAEFSGIRVGVEPGVFVPRRRTELLVREAAVLARDLSPGRVVLVDLCCGSGAVAMALAATVGDVDVHAVDVDGVAFACARRNLAGVGRVYQGDLYDPLPAFLRGRVDVLVANAPYVPTEEIDTMPPEARLHETRTALDGGADGLEVQRRVVTDAPLWLAPGGHLLVETSRRQAPGTAEAFVHAGLAPRVVRSEDLDATVVVGRRG